jgi:glycosyltransferase involved in cell wall biosynthesis
MAEPPIKILQLLVTMPVGGAEDLVASIVTGLNPEKFHARAACIGPQGAVAAELAAAGFPVASLGLDIRRASPWRVILAVRRLLKELRPDILHTHLYHPNFFGRAAALGLGLKGVVSSVHNTYDTIKIHRCLINFLLSRATDRVLMGSRQVWEDIRRYDRVPAGRLLIIPHGVDLKALAVPLTREEAKAYLGVTGFCLGAVGRLEEQKGHLYLLEALARLQEEMGDAALLLVGEGRLEETLKRRTRELGLADRVRFLGTRRDLPVIYRALDLYVQPSLWEGLSLAMLQAMGAGLPVLMSRVSGADEIIENGVSGLLTPPGDVQALSGALLGLYRDPGKRERLGDQAGRAIRENYSREAMLRRLEALYLELWDKGRGR